MKRVLFVLLIPAIASAETPAWIRNGTRLSNGIYETVCSAVAPSVDQARRQAIHSCQASATDNLNQNVEFKNIMIETERDVVLHTESFSKSAIKNLMCEPLKEEIQDNKDSVKIWVLCKFDLKKVVVENIVDTKATTDSISDAAAIRSRGVAANSPPIFDSDSRSITVSTIPACESILVRGKISRIIPCDKNPIQLLVNKSDKEIIVRKSRFKSKTILVPEIFSNDEETIDVVLDQ